LSREEGTAVYGQGFALVRGASPLPQGPCNTDRYRAITVLSSSDANHPSSQLRTRG